MKHDRGLNIVKDNFDSLAKKEKLFQEAYSLLSFLFDLSTENAGFCISRQVVKIRSEGKTWEEVGEELKISADEALNYYKAYEQSLANVILAVMMDDQENTKEEQGVMFSNEELELSVIDEKIKSLDKREKIFYRKKQVKRPLPLFC
jgi:hypothetical protein